jgi:hypothetical protein
LKPLTCWLNLVQILKDERQNFLLVIPHKVNRVQDSLSGNPIIIHYLTHYILPATKILPLTSKTIIIGVRIILIFTFRQNFLYHIGVSLILRRFQDLLHHLLFDIASLLIPKPIIAIAIANLCLGFTKFQFPFQNLLVQNLIILLHRILNGLTFQFPKIISQLHLTLH